MLFKGVLGSLRSQASLLSRIGITVKLIRNDFQVDAALNAVNFRRWRLLYGQQIGGFLAAVKARLEYTKPVVNQLIMIGGSGLRHFE